MNNVTYGLIKMKNREAWSVFMFFRNLSLLSFLSLWLVMPCMLMVPGYASAAVDTCLIDNNPAKTTLKIVLPPSVSVPPGLKPDSDTPFYTGHRITINYQCGNNTNRAGQVTLRLLGDYNPLSDALKDAGLQLKLSIQDDSSNSLTWEPNIRSNTLVSFGASYTGNTGPRTVVITPLLYIKEKKPAGFVAIPGLTAFRLTPSIFNSSNGFFIETSAARIQYIPDCFVKTTLGVNNIDFGPVIKTDVDSEFTRNRSFNVQARTNDDSSCVAGKLKDPYIARNSGRPIGTFYLELPLKVSFILNSGGVLSADKQSIILNNENNEDNGLQLKISDTDNNFVTFGDISQAENHPANKLGEFNNGIFTVSKTYTAILSPTGKQVKTGKYNAQVTVKVSYY